MSAFAWAGPAWWDGQRMFTSLVPKRGGDAAQPSEALADIRPGFALAWAADAAVPTCVGSCRSQRFPGAKARSQPVVLRRG